jgi:ABC-type polysaccharide/polyol phosphate export permease
VLYEIRTSTAGSVLGVAWAVVQPLLFLGAYWFLLSTLDARHLGPAGTESQVVVLLAGLVPWLFLSRSLTTGLGALTRHASLIRQVNFPTAVLPFVTVGVQAVDYLVGIAVLLAAAGLAGMLSWTALLLVPVSLLLAAFLAALTALLAPLGVMLRDLRRVFQVVLRAGLFVTPVLYLPAAIPDGAEALGYLNPAAYFVGLVRYAATGLDEALLLGLAGDLAVATGLTAVAAAAALAWRQGSWRLTVDHL